MKPFITALFLTMIISVKAQQINGLYGIDTLANSTAEDYLNDAVFNQNNELFVAGFMKRSPLNGGTVSEIGTLSRFDAQGNLVYSKSTTFEEINSILRTPDGHLLLTGRGTGLLCNGVCKADFWVSECDENGQFLWGRSFGNAINDGNDIGYAAALMSNGDRLVVGYYYHSSYNLKTFAVRLTPQGDTVWTKSYGMYTGQQCGYSVYVNNNDDIYIGGTTTVGGGLLLMKLSSNGQLSWAKTYVTPAGRVLKIFKKSDGTLLLCGQAINNNDYRVTLTNVDLNGALLWSKEYEVESSDHEQFFEDAFLTANDHIFLTGYFYDEVNYVTPGNKPFYMEIDDMGNVIWAKKYMSYYGEGRIIKKHPNNGIIWGGIHMQNAFTPFWPKQPESWWMHMPDNGSNDCFIPCYVNTFNASALAANKNFYSFTGFISDDPLPSAINYLTLKTLKCNSPLDTEELIPNNFQIIPNPNRGTFTVYSPFETLGNVHLVNELGQKYAVQIDGNQIITNHIPPGVYFLKFIDYHQIQKIIIY
jgi:hypothetical protein